MSLRSVFSFALGALVVSGFGALAGSCAGSGSGVEELPPEVEMELGEIQPESLISLEMTSGRGERVKLSGALESWAWSPSGVNLVRGKGDEAQVLDPESLGTVSLETDIPPPLEAQERVTVAQVTSALSALGSLGEEEAKKLARSPLAKSQDSSKQFFFLAGDLVVFEADQGARILTHLGEERPELLELSPDETQLAFVQARDLFVLPLQTGELSAITDDGDDSQYDGILDWVYQEEIYGRGNFKGFWWSPDSSTIAFLSLDESEVHPFTVIDHVESGHARVLPEVTYYPKAGDPNPSVRVGVYGVAGQDLQWIDLAEYGQSEPLVVRVSWTPDGKTLLYTVQGRTQSWAELVARDLASGERSVWIAEASSTWVSRPKAPRWLQDGSFLWESERTGYRHIFHYRPGGELLNTITKGDWEVRSILRVDEAQGSLWFTASRDGAVSENAYRVDLNGENLLRLTQGPGTHRVTPNAQGTLFLDRVSSLTRAPEWRLCDASNGTVLRVLANSKPAPAESPLLAKWELHEVPARDGFPLDVALLKPRNFDPKKTYPVWLSTYSGPNAPTIRNAWSPSMWPQFLAQEGVIVLNVNVRTASRKGHAITSLCYGQFLVQELMDIVDTVDWLTANPWADQARVGITGWSYGGSMTAYALTNSDRFALGIAGAGVYDWRMYDSVYTERYMNTPQANPEGYDKSSVLASAGNLSGHLVLVHGTKDDNVHLQNTVQLVYALQTSGQTDFELMLYPESRHGVRNGSLSWHKRQLEWAQIQTHLKPAGSAPGGQ